MHFLVLAAAILEGLSTAVDVSTLRLAGADLSLPS
jgi:hypothetical protein